MVWDPAAEPSDEQLNHLVTEQLVKCGVPAVGISPFGAWKTAGKKVSQAGISAIRDALDAGYIPVVHGDCALDSEQHCCILSGDAIIEVLSREFSPQRVVFLTDVSGIYDRPPDTPGARLVDSISVSPDGHMDPPVLTSALPHDTTGGVSLKLQAAVNIVIQSHGASADLQTGQRSRRKSMFNWGAGSGRGHKTLPCNSLKKLSL